MSPKQYAVAVNNTRGQLMAEINRNTRESINKRKLLGNSEIMIQDITIDETVFMHSLNFFRKTLGDLTWSPVYGRGLEDCPAEDFWEQKILVSNVTKMKGFVRFGMASYSAPFTQYDRNLSADDRYSNTIEHVKSISDNLLRRMGYLTNDGHTKMSDMVSPLAMIRVLCRARTMNFETTALSTTQSHLRRGDRTFCRYPRQ